MTYRGPRLSRGRMIWLHAHPLPAPLPSVSSTGVKHRKTEKRDNLLTGGGGGGGGSRIILLQESLALQKSINTEPIQNTTRKGRFLLLLFTTAYQSWYAQSECINYLQILKRFLLVLLSHFTFFCLLLWFDQFHSFLPERMLVNIYFAKLLFYRSQRICALLLDQKK